MSKGNGNINEYIEERKRDNPFYHNYLFTKEDRKRFLFKWYEHPILWFLPMKVQFSTDGAAFFKVWNGLYYFYGFDIDKTK